MPGVVPDPRPEHCQRSGRTLRRRNRRDRALHGHFHLCIAQMISEDDAKKIRHFHDLIGIPIFIGNDLEMFLLLTAENFRNNLFWSLELR